MWEEMDQFNEELIKAGILLVGEGLHAKFKGVRVRWSGKDRIVTDGPFAETKEIVAGYYDLGGEIDGRGHRLGQALPADR